MLEELHKQYLAGEIERKKAIDQTKGYMDALFELSNIMKYSIIKKIEITKNDVIFFIEENGQKLQICAEKGAYVSIATTLLGTNTKEEEITLDILSLIKENDVVFDIGANIGWYSLELLQKNPKLQIYSFEPVSYTFDYLLKNFALNSIDASKAFCMGFFNKNQDVKFYFNHKCTECSSMKDLEYVEGKSKEVVCKVMKMDDFCQERSIEKIDFIKCDVEGSELYVYQGGREIIKKSRPIVISEMLRKWTAKFEYHPNDIINFFDDLNYTCIALNRDGSKRILLEVDENTVETNYLFVPSERMNEDVFAKMLK